MRLPLFLAFSAAAVLTVAAPALNAATPPRVGIANVNQLPQPLPLPYDTAANADAQVAAAKARARKNGKKLLIDLGGNWCPDCRVLAGIMALPTVKAFVARHYELVMVDIGRFDKNLQIGAQYGIARPAGVPALLVVDPRTDKLLNVGRTSALADARNMTPQALADWLAQWV